MSGLMVKSGRGRYRAATGDEILAAAGSFAFRPLMGQRVMIAKPDDLRSALRTILAGRTHEVFGAIALDNRHRLLEHRELFAGTIDGASVHPREVVKWAIAAGAAAVVLFHNHPSGVAEPSAADELITRRLRDALALVEIRTIDHLIVAGECVMSFAERGLL